MRQILWNEQSNNNLNQPNNVLEFKFCFDLTKQFSLWVFLISNSFYAIPSYFVILLFVNDSIDVRKKNQNANFFVSFLCVRFSTRNDNQHVLVFWWFNYVFVYLQEIKFGAVKRYQNWNVNVRRRKSVSLWTCQYFTFVCYKITNRRIVGNKELDESIDAHTFSFDDLPSSKANKIHWNEWAET